MKRDSVVTDSTDQCARGRSRPAREEWSGRRPGICLQSNDNGYYHFHMFREYCRCYSCPGLQGAHTCRDGRYRTAIHSHPIHVLRLQQDASLPVFVRFKHSETYKNMIMNCPPGLSRIISPATAGLVDLQEVSMSIYVA